MSENKIRVLLVDDEPEFGEALSQRLDIRGFETALACDGETALSLAENGDFHVVVLDLFMPGIGGMETLKIFRAHLPQLPVILLSGQGSTRDGIGGMRLGAFDFLMKPIDLEELMEKIRKAAHVF